MQSVNANQGVNANEMGGLPGEIDPSRFCRAGEVLAFTAKAVEFPRLAEEFTQGMLACRLEGASDAMGLLLRVTVEGEVGTTCQRCLGELVLPLSVAHTIRLARDKTELDRLDADPDEDALPLEAKLDPVALIEDEILLSLPLAAMHEEGQCPA